MYRSIERHLTIPSSAASEASPLQRVVRPADRFSEAQETTVANLLDTSGRNIVRGLVQGSQADRPGASYALLVRRQGDGPRPAIWRLDVCSDVRLGGTKHGAVPLEPDDVVEDQDRTRGATEDEDLMINAPIGRLVKRHGQRIGATLAPRRARNGGAGRIGAIAHHFECGRPQRRRAAKRA
ncbi:hypothetical protein DO97_05830 [Neosynechococcus sphagnicola sy1]|uniref:Uncharacterized protein n=1 Tax=Neosynechococcus sphagnicola sy1 TaxID=1497020 RepID=A0A098TNH5_9CYAN|nr:hypothetical protein DO97_05830 [Neosynechococcus sphagnicola sy1]